MVIYFLFPFILLVLFLSSIFSFTPFQPSSSFLQQYNGRIEWLPGYPHHLVHENPWKQYSGYIPVHEEGSLFYWFIEKHSNSTTANSEQSNSIPIFIFWNGGPGWFIIY